MSQIAELLTLQEIDDEAGRLEARLAEVERRLEGSEELDDARRQLGEAELAAREIHTEQRRLEDEVASLSARIGPEEKRLYDGSVKNPKELTSIQHEVEVLKSQRSHLEDILVEVLDRAEAADRDLAAARSEVARLEDAWAAAHAKLEGERTSLLAAIERAGEKSARQKASVEPRALRVYEDLRRRKPGHVVVRIQGGTCSGCRIGIPDAVRTRAFAGAMLAQCPSCERILYVG